MAKNVTEEDTTQVVSTVPGSDIVLPDGRRIAVREADPEEVARFLNGGMVAQNEETSEQIMQRMVSQVFAAQSFGEALDQASVTHVRDYLDQPIVIRDVTWNKSSFVDDEGRNKATGDQVLPVFAVIHAVDSNGEPVTLTTGAFLPCAHMYAAQIRGDLSSVQVKFTKAERPTANGYYPLNLVRA